MKKTAHVTLTIIALLAVCTSSCRRSAEKAAPDPTSAGLAATATPFAPAPTLTPPPYVHIVEAGDTLGHIASSVGCTVEDIVALVYELSGLTDEEIAVVEGRDS